MEISGEDKTLVADQLGRGEPLPNGFRRLRSLPLAELVVKADYNDPAKCRWQLDIELPRFKPRLHWSMKDFEALDVTAFPRPRPPPRAYSTAEWREPTF